MIEKEMIIQKCLEALRLNSYVYILNIENSIDIVISEKLPQDFIKNKGLSITENLIKVLSPRDVILKSLFVFEGKKVSFDSMLMTINRKYKRYI